MKFQAPHRDLRSMCLCIAIVGALVAMPRPGDTAEGAPAARIIELDRVIAVVNHDVITSGELAEEFQRASAILRRQGTKVPTSDVFERQVLERMITKRVLVSSAKNAGVQVNDAEVDAATERVVADYKLTVDEFRDELEREGQSYAGFRDEVRTELLIAKLKEREVDARLIVTEADIQSYLARNDPSVASKNEEYNVAHILVSVSEQASAQDVEQRKARAQEAMAQINKGVEFAQVAATYSDAGDALKGGAMGWRSPARLPAIFVETLRALAVGSVGGPLRSPAGFHILKLVDKRGADTPTLVRQTRARHILVRLNEIVSEQDALTRLRDLKTRIENGEDFANLARLHSDDASASKGGELGWISPGDTVPEFERAMNALAINQVSEPFKSPFGWHVVQALERREQDMSEDRVRLQARQAIRLRKSEQQWEDWVRYQRDRAYVEYHLQD